jgi:23S rRNA (adenine2503-C2)-methyltransferase
MKKDIRDFSPEKLKEEITGIGQPPHRARQIFLWLNRKNVGSFDKMTNLPKSLIAQLKKKFIIGTLKCVEHLKSKDGTEKFLWKLDDGEYIETVFIREKKRRTLCLSSQVGCRFKCPFCASGTGGFIRNLRVSEITGQVLRAGEVCACRMTNIVFMGMGEPLDNYDNLTGAIRMINHPDGAGIGARKITVSTCGIVPGILKLKEFPLQVELSVSLHAADDALRNELVPVNRKYPLKELISACREYYEKTGRVITLEYALINGRNDSAGDAEKLTRIAQKLKAKVNLIDCSPVAELACVGSGREKMDRFKERLRSGRVTVTIRKSRGGDILAACGQLAARRKPAG